MGFFPIHCERHNNDDGRSGLLDIRRLAEYHCNFLLACHFKYFIQMPVAGSFTHTTIFVIFIEEQIKMAATASRIILLHSHLHGVSVMRRHGYHANHSHYQ